MAIDCYDRIYIRTVEVKYFAPKTPTGVVAFPPNLAHRQVVIDVPNVAMRHGLNKKFSCRGVQMAIEYFRTAGHRVLGCVLSLTSDSTRLHESVLYSSIRTRYEETEEDSCSIFDGWGQPAT